MDSAFVWVAKPWYSTLNKAHIKSAYTAFNAFCIKRSKLSHNNFKGIEQFEIKERVIGGGLGHGTLAREVDVLNSKKKCCCSFERRDAERMRSPIESVRRATHLRIRSCGRGAGRVSLRNRVRRKNDKHAPPVRSISTHGTRSVFITASLAEIKPLAGTMNASARGLHSLNIQHKTKAICAIPY